MMSGDAGPASRSPRSVREVVDFAEAVGALLLASLAVAVLPFRQLTRTIAAPRRRAAQGRAGADRAASEVTRSIERATLRLPLRIVCLHKGLATHWMLRRRGVASSVHYGVSPANAVLNAHVWVDVGGRTVMGEEESQAFARVATFPATGRNVDSNREA